MKIDFVAHGSAAPIGAAIVVLRGEGAEAGAAERALEQRMAGGIARALAAARFTGAAGQTAEMLAPHGLDASRLVVIGTGKDEPSAELAMEQAAGLAWKAAGASGAPAMRLELPGASADLAAAAAFGLTLAGYRFDRYRTKEPAEKKPTVVKVEIAVDDPKAAKKAFKAREGLASAIVLARDLVSEPANILHPEEFARRARKLEDLGVEVEVLGEKEMKKLGMGALLGVGQGSVRESQLAILQWNGGDKDAAPVAFVGKGVCFDTGGISIKPADGMEEMITDMGGAAAVTGTIAALAARKAKVNAVGILGLVENMPDGNAQRPGDIVTTMSGQTVEVINTDAEGRLVLADAIWYCQQRFKPRILIDLATLTGAIVISLGKDLAGLFSNNDELADRLLAAGRASGDSLWRMPLPAQYDQLLASHAADMKNIGGRWGGSITAALFIQRFIKDTPDKLPWAHLDIASTAWKPDSKVATIPSGATGFGVRLLDRLVADHYED